MPACPRIPRAQGLALAASLVLPLGLYLISRDPWVLAGTALCLPMAGATREAWRAARERDQAQVVVEMVRQAAPALSRASFDAARAATLAHEAAGRTGEAADGVARAATRSREAATAVETAAAAALQTQTAAQNTSGRLDRIGTELEQVRAGSREAQQRVGELAEAIRAVEAAAATIEAIAVQTRLLALNAKIEAAHAGAAGKGFAVVAQEVRKLSDEASGRAKEIQREVRQIVALNGHAVTAVEGMARTAEATTRQVRATLQEVGEAVAGVSVVTDRLHGAQASSDDAAQEASDLSGQAQALSGAIRALGDLSATSAHDVGDCLERLLGTLAEQDVDCEHTRRKRQALALAAAAGQALDALVAAGEVSEQDLFSPSYTDIPRTDPPKKSTGWDRLCDRVLPPLQEPLLEAGAAYAIVVNADGYCPTHNARFSQALTGDYATDLANNRTKRVFSDPVGQRCTRHQGVLVQTYLRDTGQTMHDLSVPVQVRGRRWGAVRVGYLAAQA